MQKAYNKLDIVVNISVCTHFNNFHIDLLKSANMIHIEIYANFYILIQYLDNIILDKNFT